MLRARFPTSFLFPNPSQSQDQQLPPRIVVQDRLPNRSRGRPQSSAPMHTSSGPLPSWEISPCRLPLLLVQLARHATLRVLLPGADEYAAEGALSSCQVDPRVVTAQAAYHWEESARRCQQWEDWTMHQHLLPPSTVRIRVARVVSWELRTWGKHRWMCRKVISGNGHHPASGERYAQPWESERDGLLESPAPLAHQRARALPGRTYFWRTVPPTEAHCEEIVV